MGLDGLFWKITNKMSNEHSTMNFVLNETKY